MQKAIDACYHQLSHISKKRIQSDLEEKGLRKKKMKGLHMSLLDPVAQNFKINPESEKSSPQSRRT